jgi:hypothetical protein
MTGIFLLILAGIVFLPWDVPAPDDADLQVKCRIVPTAEDAFPWFEQALTKTSLDVMDAKGVKRRYDEALNWDKDPAEIADADFLARVLNANAEVFPLMEKGIASQSMRPIDSNACSSLTPLAKLLLLKGKSEQAKGPMAAIGSGLQLLDLGRKQMGNPANFSLYLGLCSGEDGLDFLWRAAQDPAIPDKVLESLAAALASWNWNELAEYYRINVRMDYQDFINTLHGPKGKRETVLSFVYVDCYPVDSLEFFLFPPYCFKPNLTTRRFAEAHRRLINRAGLPYAEFIKGATPIPFDPA